MPDLTYLRTPDDGNGRSSCALERESGEVTVDEDEDDVEHVFLTTFSGDFCG